VFCPLRDDDKGGLRARSARSGASQSKEGFGVKKIINDPPTWSLKRSRAWLSRTPTSWRCIATRTSSPGGAGLSAIALLNRRLADLELIVAGARKVGASVRSAAKSPKIRRLRSAWSSWVSRAVGATEQRRVDQGCPAFMGVDAAR
jgi:hypothetical protein